MATLPTLESLGNLPSPQPSSGVVGYQSGTGAEAATSEMLAKQGTQLQGEGDRMWRWAQIEQNHADTMRAEDATNQLRQIGLDNSIGEAGFANMKGGQVAANPEFFKTYNERMAEATNKIAESLDNDQQREKFKARADVFNYQFRHELISHIVKERGAYAEQVYKGTVETELQQVTARWADPAAIALSLERMNAAGNAEAERVGAAPQMRKAILEQNEAKVHTAVISQALASGNYGYAKAWFEKHGENVDLQTARSIEHAIAEGTQKQLFNAYQQEFIGSGRTIQGLTALEKNVTADQTLDETRKTVLLGRIEARMESLNRKAEMEALRAEAAVTRQITAINSMTLQGYEPTAEQLAPLIGAARGTALEPQVKQMVAVANQTAQFRAADPRTQEAMITGLEAKVRKNPTPDGVKILDAYKSIARAQANEIKEDPISFAARKGLAEVKPLDFSKPDTLGDQLASRLDIAGGMKARYGAPLAVLTREEAGMLARTLKDSSEAQQRGLLGTLAKSVPDREAYNAMMAQIAPDQPVLSVAGVYAARGLTSNQGRVIADAILTGQAALNPAKKEDGKPVKAVVPMPADEKFNTAFADYERDAFSGKPQARNAFLQTARAIYAAKSMEAGDFTGEMNARRFEEAMALATGGVERHNGRAIVMPYGVKYGQFKDELSDRVRSVVASKQLDPTLTASRLSSLPLENVGDGRYVFRAGDGVLSDRNGRPVVIDFNRPAK